MSMLRNFYKNSTPGIVKFLEIEYNSPARPQNQYADHTLIIHLRRDGIYTLDRYHELMISVSTNGVIAFSDCEYFHYINDGHTLSILFNNNAYSRNLSIEVEGNDLGNVKFTELSVETDSKKITPFMTSLPTNDIYGYISKVPVTRGLSANENIYIACLAYSSYVIGEQNGGKQCLIYGDQSYQLTNIKLELVKTIKYVDIDTIYIYKVSAGQYDRIILW